MFDFLKSITDTSMEDAAASRPLPRQVAEESAALVLEDDQKAGVSESSVPFWGPTESTVQGRL